MNQLLEINELIESEIIEKTEKYKRKVEAARGDQKKRGRKRKNKLYFTKETENAIVLYNTLEHDMHKNIVYKRFIQHPFEKIAENIYNTYKFMYFDSTPEDVQMEVVSHLLINMDKYKAEKGKAFSYFSVMAKNYLIIKNNANYKRYKISPLLSVMSDDLNETFDSHSTNNVEDDLYLKEISEFTDLMSDFWTKYIPTEFTNKRDIDIAYAVLSLFDRVKYIENFNKKAIWIQIREMTGAKTQQVTKVVNKMKEVHFKMMKEFRKKGNIDTLLENYEFMW